ncbi:hypothetical protein DFAR_2000001 [Desulfarculales bacterium]
MEVAANRGAKYPSVMRITAS